MTFLRNIIIFSTCVIFSYQKPLKVTLFYETLCPDCKEFILEQLFPAYEKIGTYLLMDMVPYGFATSRKVNGKWEFECQHGPVECYRNKLEACAMAQTADAQLYMKFIYCVEGQDKNAFKEELEKCAQLAELNWNFLDNCANGDEGSKLLLRYEKRMREAKPQVKYVPTVFFDNYFNNTLEKKAESNFFKTACALLDHLPKICKEEVDEESHETFIL